MADPNQFAGMTSPQDVSFLMDLAQAAPDGAIVEIGSYRGKSAIALATGASLRAGTRPTVYSIEPHADFVGVYGGRFGPIDRAAYYQAMLDSGCAEHVALVNLPSVSASKAWDLPIGLLFVDGDHRLEGVKNDAEAWLPFVVVGGIVAFDDALDPTIGPYHIVAELLQTGRFEHLGATDKISALRKCDGPGLVVR